MTRLWGMRWATGGAVAIVIAVRSVGAVAGDRAATAPTASRGCYPKSTTTIVQDKAGRFYFAGGKWYVCAFKQGTPRIVYNRTGRSGVVDRSAKVSGRYVAFLVVGPGPSSMRVFDMVTGHPTFSAYTYPPGPPSSLPSANLVLKPDGSVAWLSKSTVNYTVTWYVNRHDSTGTATVDSGPGIEPQSLAAGGSWLYWTDAGSPRSAPFH